MPAALFAQEPLGTTPPAAPTVRLIRITGNKGFSEPAVLDKVRIAPGQPLSETAEHVAQLERDYRDEDMRPPGKGRVRSGTGTLTLTIDEGVIDGVEFGRR